MEIIIGLVILAGVSWFFIMRNGKKIEVAAPYKVETPAPVSEPFKVEETKDEVNPAGTEASVAAPVKKAPAKPKAATKPKAPAKTATAKEPAKTTKAKEPAKTTKAKAPAKPKVTVAK